MTAQGSGTRGQSAHEVAPSQQQSSSPLLTLLQQGSALELAVGLAETLSDRHCV